MTREILFRGKRLDNGEWVYGYVDATMNKDIVVIHTDSSTHEVDPATVGQYTGLTDKNGNKIFEGDVVYERNACETGFIEWDGMAFVMNAHHSDGTVSYYIPYPSVLSRESPREFEIVGNIYDREKARMSSRIAIARIIDANWVNDVRQHHPNATKAINDLIEQERDWCSESIELGFRKHNVKPAPGSVVEYNVLKMDDGSIKIEAWREVEGGEQ